MHFLSPVSSVDVEVVWSNDESEAGDSALLGAVLLRDDLGGPELWTGGVSLGCTVSVDCNLVCIVMVDEMSEITVDFDSMPDTVCGILLSASVDAVVSILCVFICCVEPDEDK